MFFVLNSIHKDKSFHCDVCNVCLDKRLEGKHKCRPDSGHDECCICLEVGEDLLFFTKKTWLHVHSRQLCIFCRIVKLVLLLNLHEVDKGGGNKWPLGTKSCFVDMVEHHWCSTASSFRFFTLPSGTEKYVQLLIHYKIPRYLYPAGADSCTIIDGLISTTNKTFLSEYQTFIRF